MVHLAVPDVDIHGHPLLEVFVIAAQVACAEGDLHVKRPDGDDDFAVALDIVRERLDELDELHFYSFQFRGF